MPDNNSVPMLAPDGSVRQVPQDQTSSAVQAGGKLVIQMRSPQGDMHWVPFDSVHDAMKAGGQMVPPALTVGAPSSMPGMQSANFARQPANSMQSVESEQTPEGNAAAIAQRENQASTLGHVAIGVGKGVGQTGHTLGRVANMATGDNVSSLPTSFQQPESLETHGTAEGIGAGIEGIGEFLIGDEALKGLTLAEKLNQTAKLAKLAEDSPLAAKLINAGINATRGAVVSGTQSALHDPSLSSAATGAGFGAGGELLASGASAAAGNLFPRTTQAATQAARDAEATAQAGRQATASRVGNIARNAVTDITGAASSADSFRDAADQIRTTFNPVYDKLREAVGGIKNPLTGRYSANAFDDATNQIARAKKVIFSPSPTSTDTLRQAEKELSEGQEKLNGLFDSSSLNKDQLQAAKSAWSKASMLDDLHGYLDKAYTQPAGVRKLGTAAAEVDPAKFVRQANKAIDDLNAGGKLQSAIGNANFRDLTAVRQGLDDALTNEESGKSVESLTRKYLKGKAPAVSSAGVAGAVGATSHYLLGASNPVATGVALTAGTAHWLYSHPDAAVPILRAAAKAAPLATQAAKQIVGPSVTHVFDPETGEVEPATNSQ